MARVRVIDMLRGICMVYIVWGHTLQFWINPDNGWIFSIIFTMSETMGANCFLFLSGIAFTFSIRSRQEKQKLYPNLPQPPLWQEVHSRTLFICVFSFLFNAVSMQHSLWNYYILQTMWVSRLLMFPFMQKSVRWRVGLTAVVIAASPLIYWGVYPLPNGNPVQGILFYFLFNEPALNIIFPFFAFYVAGTVVGELFWERRNRLFQTGYNEMKHILAKMGGIILVTGFFMGMVMVNWDFGWDTLASLNTHPWWNFSGLPLFFLRGTPPWALISIGTMFCVLAFLCHIEQHPRIRYAESRFLSIFSAQSLTIFFWHHVVALLFSNSFDNYTLWFPQLSFVILVWGITWIWVRKFDSKYSLEWVINEGVKVLLRKYYAKGPATAE